MEVLVASFSLRMQQVLSAATDDDDDDDDVVDANDARCHGDCWLCVLPVDFFHFTSSKKNFRFFSYLYTRTTYNYIHSAYDVYM